MLVYKYRSGNKRDIKALVNNQIYIPSFKKLNDIFEAMIEVDNNSFSYFNLLGKLTTKEDNTFTEIWDNYYQETQSFGIYSLSKKYDDELLWALY